MVPDGLIINPGATRPVNVQPGAQTGAPQNTLPEPNGVSGDDTAMPAQTKLDPEILAKITDELNEDFRVFNTAISFAVDEDTGDTIIRILDRETNEVIREIPPSEMLRLAARLTEIIGLLIDETA